MNSLIESGQVCSPAGSGCFHLSASRLFGPPAKPGYNPLSQYLYQCKPVMRRKTNKKSEAGSSTVSAALEILSEGERDDPHLPSISLRLGHPRRLRHLASALTAATPTLLNSAVRHALSPDIVPLILLKRKIKSQPSRHKKRPRAH